MSIGHENTRSIAVDYIKYRLQCNGYTWRNDGRHESIINTPNSIQNAMRILGDEFEERFKNRFDNLIDGLVITDDNAYDTFASIVIEIFCEDINWGRIVALFDFSGQFAARCFQLKKYHLVDNLLEWLTTYIDIHLSSWLNSHNNWVSNRFTRVTKTLFKQKSSYRKLNIKAYIKLASIFFSFTQEGFLEFKSGRGENKNGSSWPSLKTILGCAAAGIGILTLCALFALQILNTENRIL